MKAIARYYKRFLAVTAAFFVTVFFTSGFYSKANKNDEDFKRMAEEIVILVNEARADAGLKPLYVAPYLNDIAHVRARECIARFSHYRPSSDPQADEHLDNPQNTVSFITALDENLVPYSKAAENLAAGADNAEATFEQWRNSPKHWAAIMNPDYTHIGVACTYEQNSTYKYYWEQFFVATTKKLDNQTIPEKYKTVPISSGDINGDSEINSFDLITLNRYLADDTMSLNDLQIQSADMFKDGVITSADAAALRKYLLGDYKTLPVTLDMLMK